jgi:hypothetical protein
MSNIIGYIPTVNGRPSVFFDNYQLCIGGGRRFHVVIVPSLREVRRQIQASIRNRRKDGLDASLSAYGYVRVGRVR